MAAVNVLAAKSVVNQLWPLVGTGVFALLGVWIGKASERRSGTAAWLRDQRLVAFGAMLEISHSFLLKATRVEKHPDNSDYADELDEVLAQLGRAGARIELLGPRTVTRAAEAYYDAHIDVERHVSSDGSSAVLLKDTDLIEALDTAQKRFLAVSQAALTI